MDVPATGARFGSAGDSSGDETRARFERDRHLRALRARWRTASLAAGWRFPSDWALPEVDAVCAAVVRHGSTGAETALAGLGRARAAAGAGLSETLSDLAALHAVLADPDAVDGFVAPDVDATPARLLRVTALAWADVATDQLVHTEVTDPLTGLPSAAYLRTRLGEIYRGGVNEANVLLTVSLDLTSVSGWPRLTAMILAADAVRAVFDTGECYATIGPSAVAVLAERNERLATRGVALRRALNERLAVDPQLRDVARPLVSAVRLPGTHDRACELLTELAHS
ncbi:MULTISPECIES: GGDEF domain-containing protein [Amycolatopsis]|uniref:GGDEF domain-containing protein n=1 Tax=Amycolatopsis silviterrae TaxID=1656914 RepID=A0ABW5GZZ0_9PSEU